MAENIRIGHSEVSLNDEELRKINLVKECWRQYDNCKYSSTSLFIWKKHARVWRFFLITSPIILGGIASWQVLSQSGTVEKLIGAVCGLLAGILPAISKALNIDVHLESLQKSANEFTNIRDRFRRAATVTAFASFEELNAEFEALMDRMDAARTSAPPSPEWSFEQAQKKISRGDYDYDVDGRPKPQ